MRGMPVVYGTLLVALGSALLAGCGAGASSQATGDKTTDADPDVPDGPERANSIVVRVSGTEGVSYLGFYGTVAEGEDLQGVDDVVGTEPIDYEVEVPEVGSVANVFAEFEKTEIGQGELRMQILGDDMVVEEARTLSRLGRVRSEWYSGEHQIGPPPGGVEMVPPEIETTEEVVGFGPPKGVTEAPPKSSP